MANWPSAVTSGFEVKLVTFTAAQAGIRAVREQVFVGEQHVPLELEWDGMDPSANHVIAIDPRQQIIGTGRILADGHIGRMAVLRDWRHQGVGSAMLNALCTYARNSGMGRVFLAAQIHATDFYRRHGFQLLGEEYLEAGIPHRDMFLILGEPQPEQNAG